ncbi:DUF7504 family protein [Halomicrococcus sp. NG-SE-24]|uniref:DUF7504 family protein n=1 Tax=Halomicrococcus sp. NG-SE-24 TaxID=3436928 RepID=UPI003D9578B6
MSADPRSPGPDDGARFHYWLQKLKQRGSNLLITGTVSDDVSARASQRLFGQKRDRARILALTDRTETNPASRLPDGVSVTDPGTWFIDQRHGERSIPDAATNATFALDHLDKYNVHQLGEEIQAAISFYVERTDDLAPAALRVGIDSLYPLLQNDRAATERTLRMLTTAVHDVRGMAHYHIRIPDDAPLVEDLTSLFDARIELRKRRRLPPEQRWHVPELGQTTAWVEL